MNASRQYPATERIIRLRELCHRTGLSRSTIYNLVNGGQLQSPVHISARAIGWHDSYITGWIETRQATKPSTAKSVIGTVGGAA